MLKMKRFAICLLALVISSTTCMVMAQDVVYLKNGSVIKGSVIEMVPNQTIKIQTADGSLFVYQTSEVDRVERDNNKRSENNEEVGDYLERGFRGIIDLSSHYGVGDAEDNYLLTASFTPGYQITHFLFVGAGVAPTLVLFDNKYYDEVETSFILPIYGAIRFDFINARVSPFLDLRSGYSVTNDCKGFYGYAGVGCRIFKWSLSAGYTYQKNESSRVDHFDFIGIRAGLEF